MEEFPGNSQRAKRPAREDPPTPVPQERRKVERVVQGEVVLRKPSRLKRLRNLFVPDDGRSLKDMIVDDIIVPRAKDMFMDSMESLVYRGGHTPRRHIGRYAGAAGPVAYNAFASKPVGRGTVREERPTISQRGRMMHDFQEILLPSRQEATLVLDGMYEILSQYHEVTVRDLYELAGVSSEFTDVPWGWTDLFGSGVRSARNGFYILDLPQPKLLEK